MVFLYRQGQSGKTGIFIQAFFIQWKDWYLFKDMLIVETLVSISSKMA